MSLGDTYSHTFDAMMRRTNCGIIAVLIFKLTKAIFTNSLERRATCEVNNL